MPWLNIWENWGGDRKEPEVKKKIKKILSKSQLDILGHKKIWTLK